jgi:site-specific recombinase XerC
MGASADLKAQLRDLIVKYGTVRMKDGHVASFRTIQVHHQVLARIVDILYELGFKLECAENLGGRHVQALASALIELGYSPKSMQSIWTELRYWAVWIKKPGLVRPLHTYLTDVPPSRLKATVAARSSKSWTAAGLNVLEKIEAADQMDMRLGCMLRAGLAFGLRLQEQICLKPHAADQGTYLRVFPGDGPKSGRGRDIRIEHAWQRDVLEYIKARVPKSHYLGWQQSPSGKHGRLRANKDRYQKFMQKLCITKAQSGVTATGMRAEYSENAAMLAGMLPATLGGRADQMDPDDLKLIQEKIMERMGHGRASVAAAYYGSFRLTDAPAKQGLSSNTIGPNSIKRDAQDPT